MNGFYKQSKTDILDRELFKNPTSEYRATPFWSWNNKLSILEMERQIDCFKEMGFGGFHAHCRTGLDTEYLGEHFMDAVKRCNQKAKDNGMLMYLYDEDGYSSGFAGGLLTKEPVHRGRRIVFTTVKREEVEDRETAVKEGKVYLVAAFDIEQDEQGYLKNYYVVSADSEIAENHVRWYAYCETHRLCGWYNGYTYFDILRKETVDEFCRITLGAYKQNIGREFSKSIPSIFTDEPLALRFTALTSSFDKDGATMPWTPDFDASFQEKYGFRMSEKIPEIFFELPKCRPSRARYLFHKHILDLFSTVFSDNYGKTTREYGLRLTGHLYGEGTLYNQTIASGECMRNYMGFDIPGVDVLCDEISYSTLKQAQSVVRQTGKEGMISELYGVTGWDFDFRGHKFQGDWQAALGVTLRAPHLCWLSMKGANKRDYPASIGPQSPWYKEYRYVEDHFARLNTVLTRGKPRVSICVIHPVETAWLLAGPKDLTLNSRAAYERAFSALTSELLLNQLDFDYASEDMLPLLGSVDGQYLAVGKMKYKVVIVPKCKGMRNSTVKLLERFSKAGGTVIFADECPTVCDGEESDAVKRLYDSSVKANGNFEKLVAELDVVREVSISYEDGRTPLHYIHNLREDTDCRWLFVAHAKHIEDSACDRLLITVKGEFTPEIYDTVSGNVKYADFAISNGKTVIKISLYNNDSLLLRLGAPAEREHAENIAEQSPIKLIDTPETVVFCRDSDNCLVLDYAECQFDNSAPVTQNVMMFDYGIRQKLGYQSSVGDGKHPWTIPDIPPQHIATLTYWFKSEYECVASFAYEQAISAEFNGQKIDLTPKGYFVDAEILKTGKVLNIRKGVNTLKLVAGVGEKYLLENCFVLGDFDVSVNGKEITVKKPSRVIGCQSITDNGMPFYCGNLTYKYDLSTPDCDLNVRVPSYKGALIKVFLDGEEKGIIAYAPYSITLKDVAKGEHTIGLMLFGHCENTFGRVLHNTECKPWYGMADWHPSPEHFSDNYGNVPIGILKKPEFTIH